MRKKIIKKELFSPRVWKVYYEDGNWGLLGFDDGEKGPTTEGEPKAEVTDDVPATEQEMRDIEEALKAIRAKTPDPVSVMRESELPGYWEKEMKLKYNRDPRFRSYSDDMTQFKHLYPEDLVNKDEVLSDKAEEYFEIIRNRYPEQFQEIDDIDGPIYNVGPYYEPKRK